MSDMSDVNSQLQVYTLQLQDINLQLHETQNFEKVKIARYKLTI